MIELILTLALLGLLVALAIPTFTELGTFIEKQMFLQLLAADLSYAQTQATSEEAEVRVWFDTQTGHVITTKNDQLLRQINIPRRFHIRTNFAGNQLIFRTTGQSIGGTIWLQQGTEVVGKLVIQVASGVPRLEIVTR